MSYVTTQIPADELRKVKDSVNQLNKMIAGNAVNIKDEKKKGVRIMAEGREGLVRLVSKVATQHEDSLSRKDSAASLEKKLEYDSNLESTRQAILELLELIDGTQWGNSADIMEISDRFMGSLQGQRANNTALDSSMNEIDEWNKRFGAAGNNGGNNNNNAPVSTP